jgi:hypothetical protein
MNYKMQTSFNVNEKLHLFENDKADIIEINNKKLEELEDNKIVFFTLFNKQRVYVKNSSKGPVIIALILIIITTFLYYILT